MNNQLLPPNTTPMENNLADTAARISNVDTTAMATVWNVDTCPAAFLPWLAWALAVDYWNSNWTESIKRAYLKQHLDSRRTRGTAGSLKASLASLNIDTSVVEWFQETPVQAAPGTFYVDVALLDEGISAETQQEIDDIINRHKNVRSHLTIINIFQPVEGDAIGALALHDSEIVTVYPEWWVH